jgi:hypothetical protein
MTRTLTIWVAGGFLLSACGEPAHLQHSYATSYDYAFEAQADLERAGAQGEQITLTGEEGLALRQRVAESTSDAEAGETVQD